MRDERDPTRKYSGHAQRWISALVALPFLIGLIIVGGAPFAVMIGLICAITLCEYFRLTFHPGGATGSGFILAGAVVISLTMIWAAHAGLPAMAAGLVSGYTILCGVAATLYFGRDPHIQKNIAGQIQGLIYIGLPLTLIVSIRAGADGMGWIFFLLAIIFAGDVAAYYVGSRLGRHKLAPRVSPGKTIEGALGGLAGNLLAGAVFKALLLPNLPWAGALLFIPLAGAAGQVGDLFESTLKRNAGIKDSGFVLPGHGGILDRIDALLFAIPIAWLFKEYLLT